MPLMKMNGEICEHRCARALALPIKHTTPAPLTFVGLARVRRLLTQRKPVNPQNGSCREGGDNLGMYGSQNFHQQQQNYDKGEKHRIEPPFELTTTSQSSDLCTSAKSKMSPSGVCCDKGSVRGSFSAGGSAGHLCAYGDDHLEDQTTHAKMDNVHASVHCQCRPLPAHYGSTSTTYSSESSNLTNSSFGGTSEVRHFQADQTSVASSSGVATMSSTDHLPLIDASVADSSVHSPPLSRSSADDSTPTISTLSGGVTRMARELGSLLGGAAHSLASSGNVLSNTAAAAAAFSSLSLSTPASTLSLSPAGPAVIDLEGKYNLTPKHNADKMKTVGAKNDTEGLLASHSHAHSSPSLSGTGCASSDCEWRKQLDTATSLPAGCNESAQKQRSLNGADLTLNPETSSASAPMTAFDTLLPNGSPNVPSTSSALPGQLPHLGATSVPIPSVFNCAATSCSQILCTPLRTIVSQNRRRYQMDGFNLDLTYITDRIIAMGYPADTREALYRNSMNHIVRFLEHYHPGHYKVFNLRGQYVYDPANFHNRVVSFEMTDHHPPRLELMAPFCREVHDYLDADPQNVVAVHCKAGKGRTGVMICAYLCYISFYRIPRQNMDYYSIIRTHNNKGVTIPSQRRYVYYFSHLRERKLNYMPLRCELVGVYLERPPKLGGPFSKGALKVRVAVGDVDVFLGNELWLDGEKYEEEEELHKRFPLMSGEDHYDPSRTDAHHNCISRRCYGWTVPENRRVFLEGDVRVDIFQKSQLKLFNVKQEKKKIGHIWFNTMFTCPGFCGDAYTHGDEEYSYPEAMIVRRCYKRNPRQLKNTEKRQGQHEDSNSEKEDTGRGRERSVPAANRLGGLRLNGTAETAIVPEKKRSARSPCRQLIEMESRNWQSQDGEEHPHKTHQSGCRASLDIVTITSGDANNDSEWVEEIVVERPPGLAAHCPEESLKRIFPNDKQAPRYGIEEMIRDAFHKNLISDAYNTRRMSQARGVGQPIPKAPIGRPNANGPSCLMRRPDEHVSVFGVQEIDRAYKNKDMDTAFKLFIVTRCIDESNEKNVLLAEQHIAATRQKQAQKDKEKSNKIEQRQRKLGPTSSTAAQSVGHLDSSSLTLADSSHASCSSSSSIAVSSCASSLSSQSQLTATDSASTSLHNLCFPNSLELRRSNEDPRLSDPHLRKFFFRQRLSSQSRHPHIHHHCSLRSPDPRICAKFACDGTTDPIRNGQSSLFQQRRNYENVNSTTFCASATEEIEEDGICKTDDDSFNDYEFFHPRQTTCSTIRGEEAEAKREKKGTEDNNNLSSSSSVSTITAMTRTKTLSNGAKQHEEWHKKRSLHQEPLSRKKSSNQVLERSSLISSPSSEHTELEVFHPSDCSLAPSSSSCSSSDSLENHRQSRHCPELANNLQSQSHHQHHRHSHKHRNHSSHKSGDSGSRSSRERK
ncbi:hypothetical protein niasHT_015756 [Heterodera trifolii]|uniref:Phosphatidylinositol-3,4,5-trisphosphate 3-phosphatase n=1 Tax=Heterodera trifolii TaxID=157864 RepID=A0ABD2L4J7_9BILA